jgi:hypothetical protein
VVVDHEEGACIASEHAKAPRQRQEVSPSERLVAELEDVGAAPERGGRKGDQAIGVLVGGDDVEVCGEEAVMGRV